MKPGCAIWGGKGCSVDGAGGDGGGGSGQWAVVGRRWAVGENSAVVSVRSKRSMLRCGPEMRQVGGPSAGESTGPIRSNWAALVGIFRAVQARWTDYC